jgi:hypothetical protein
MDLDPLVNTPDSPVQGSAFVAKLSPGLADKAKLLEAVASALRFPPYSGGGWDALSKGLCDLDWLGDRDVVLVHPELPALPQPDLPVYLEVLRESMDEQGARRRRRMHVIFDKKNSDRLVSMRTWDEH